MATRKQELGDWRDVADSNWTREGQTLADVLEEMKNWQLRHQTLMVISSARLKLLSRMVDSQDEEIAQLKETIRLLLLQGKPNSIVGK